MDKRLASTLTVVAAVAFTVCLAAPSALAEPSATTHAMTIAQAEDTAPESAPKPDDQTLTNPDANTPVTPEEVAECMKSWDPQTGMSKEEYEKSCKSTLKYFPEKPD